jgi:hypothetical protein
VNIPAEAPSYVRELVSQFDIDRRSLEARIGKLEDETRRLRQALTVIPSSLPVELRDSDPDSPVVGQIWLRTDI